MPAPNVGDDVANKTPLTVYMTCQVRRVSDTTPGAGDSYQLPHVTCREFRQALALSPVFAVKTRNQTETGGLDGSLCVGLCFCLRIGVRWTVSVFKPDLAVHAKLVDQRYSRSPFFGQAVFHARRDLRVLPAGDNPCSVKHSKARRKHTRANTGGQLQLLKSPTSAGEITNQQQRPVIPEQLCCSRDRTVLLFVVYLCHGFFPQLALPHPIVADPLTFSRSSTIISVVTTNAVLTRRVFQ